MQAAGCCCLLRVARCPCPHLLDGRQQAVQHRLGLLLKHLGQQRGWVRWAGVSRAWQQGTRGSRHTQAGSYEVAGRTGWLLRVGQQDRLPAAPPAERQWRLRQEWGPHLARDHAVRVDVVHQALHVERRLRVGGQDLLDLRGGRGVKGMTVWAGQTRGWAAGSASQALASMRTVCCGSRCARAAATASPTAGHRTFSQPMRRRWQARGCVLTSIL